MKKDYRAATPDIAKNTYIARSAAIIGRVKISEKSSIWPGAVIRGDIEQIEIKESSNIQDGVLIHTSPDFPVIIEKNVTVGHGAVLHGCKIKSNVLIGMGAILLDGAVVEEETIVAAGSLVPEGKILQSGWLYMGSPAVKKREINDTQKEMIIKRAQEYIELAGLV
ncbi:MAG: gamma carbonic anhydrase family protein [Elusimicrobia bacterium]|jgi:carbonic anhydrase/acetyltransferase-like protein (isoleucine patch superfamily)|nr:gamma carbonic anhydrase family protein [Elusimicrobiota bacterium]